MSGLNIQEITMLNKTSRFFISLQDFIIKRKEYFLFSMVFLLGALFIFMIPPFQKPDETAHFLRVVSVSEGQFYCHENSSDVKIFSLPTKYLDFMTDTGAYRMAGGVVGEKFGVEDLKNAEKRESSEERVEWQGLCGLPFITYLLPAIAVYVGEVVGSISLSFYFGRLISFAIFFIALVWSYKKIEYSKLRWVIIMYAFIPMVLHQSTAIGYDYLQLALVPILFALNVNFVESNLTKKYDIYLYCLSMSLLLVAKPGYYFFFLLYFLIPWEKVFSKRKYYVFYTAFFFLFSLSLTLLVSETDNWSGLFSTKTCINPVEQFKLSLDPVYLFRVMKSTLRIYLDTYIQGFIGFFGWLDYHFPTVVYMLFISVWLYVSRSFSDSKFFNKLCSKVVLIGLMLFLSTSFIFASFYLTVNCVGYPTIDGIQGRYFLVFFPYMILLLSGIIKGVRRSKFLKILISAVVFFLLLLEICSLTYKRYYGYSFNNLEKIVLVSFPSRSMMIRILQ